MKSFIEECNELLREGYDSVDSSWREVSTIESVEDFKTPCDRREQDNKTTHLPTPYLGGLKTYAKLLTLTREAIESGEYRSTLRNSGRQSAIKFNELFAKEAERHPKPIEATVTFLNNQQYPVVEECDKSDDGSITIRGYFDFGIEVQSAAPLMPINTAMPTEANANYNFASGKLDADAWAKGIR